MELPYLCRQAGLGTPKPYWQPPVFIRALQWRPGLDVPGIQPYPEGDPLGFRLANISERTNKCQTCGVLYLYHGVTVQGISVCPDDWLIWASGLDAPQVLKPDVFAERFQEVEAVEELQAALSRWLTSTGRGRMCP